MPICAYTSICAEDGCWIDQYLAEAERLDLPFAIHLDRVLFDHVLQPGIDFDPFLRLLRHPLCVGNSQQTDLKIEFTEMHKQGVFDLVVKQGYDWAMAWDVDESYEKDAPRKLAKIDSMRNAEMIDVRWVNLWGDKHHIRIDGPLSGGHRLKFHFVSGNWKWKFMHPVTNGPKHDGYHLEDPRLVKNDLVCLHHGLMTQELREMHKARWDRIYTKAVGANPYSFWNFVLDPEVTQVVVENPY